MHEDANKQRLWKSYQKKYDDADAIDREIKRDLTSIKHEVHRKYRSNNY